ncbi:MAG: hypothetical protein P1U88_20935 [Thalassobaculaceae bacterium]|nr:hypothetical protein [Thalassobaculaceae bacterium]
MYPYNAQENDWLSGSANAAAATTPLEKPVAVIDYAVIRMHMRRGERMRAQEVQRIFTAVYRFPGITLRAIGAYLNPAAARPNH